MKTATRIALMQGLVGLVSAILWTILTDARCTPTHDLMQAGRSGKRREKPMV
jgi:hypothetical protein